MNDRHDDEPRTFFDQFKAAIGLRVGKHPGPKLDKVFWTAFAFQHEPDPNKLHVTHKYYGALSMFESCVVQAAIIKHFRKVGGYRPFTVQFSEQEFFGTDNTIAVLKPSGDESFILPYTRLEFDRLRLAIDMYRQDDWKYSPHVTTNQDLVHGVLDRYVLMHGRTIIGEWK